MNSFVILYRLDFNIARITKNNLTNGYSYLSSLIIIYAKYFKFINDIQGFLQEKSI